MRRIHLVFHLFILFFISTALVTAIVSADELGASTVPWTDGNSLLSGTMSDFLSVPISGPLMFRLSAPEREQSLTAIPQGSTGTMDKDQPSSLFTFRSVGSSGAWVAVNENQRLYIQMTSKNGIQITNKKGTMGMKLAGIGREENLPEVPAGIIRVEDDRLEIIRGTGTEWYLNKNTGIEQGMTLGTRPEGTGELRITFNLFGTLVPALEHKTLVFSDRNGPVIQYAGLAACDATGRDLPVKMFLSGNRLSWQIDDHNAVYPVTIDPLLTEVKILVASDRAEYAQFGNSVGISGNMAIAGAGGAKSGGYAYAGQAYIFQKDVGGTDNWGQVAILNASDPALYANFGTSVSISGDTAIIGASQVTVDEQSRAGQAYIFQKDAGGSNNWGQVAILNASDPALYANFGISVCISNDTAIIGARSAPIGILTNAGQAYIFQKDAGGSNNWGQIALLNASDKAAHAYFGTSASLSGDTAIVGAGSAASMGYTNAGQVYIFQKDAGGSNNWGQVAILNASDPANYTYFGSSASISADMAIVGAYGAKSGPNSSAGQAYIFQKDAGGSDMWGQVAILNASDRATNMQFGYSVGISEDTAIAGAYGAKSGPNSSAGQAYIFQKDAGGTGKWGQVSILNASDRANYAQFGYSVGISGDKSFIGANHATWGYYSVVGQAYIFGPEQPPVANFTADVISGKAPLSVQFTDTSTNKPSLWTWNATNVSGNKTVFIFASTQKPIQVFGVGNFSIALTVSNSAGSNISTQVMFINVSAPVPVPVPGFTADKTNGTAPLSVQFTDTSTHTPTGWAWFFGDENYTATWSIRNASGAGWSARREHSSVAMPDGSIVLSGWYGNAGYTNDVWRSTDNGATWSRVNASAGWTARSSHSSVAMPDGSIVLSGGASTSGYMNDVWRSTDNGATWSRVNASAGWAVRTSHSSVAMADGSIVLLGGYSTVYKNDTWRSTDNGATWTQMNASAGWAARWWQSSVAIPDGSVVLMGGLDGSNIKRNDTWRSTDNGATWTLVNASSGWSERYGHSSVAMADGSIILMGGYDGISPSNYKKDVWRSTDNGATWSQVNANAGWTARYAHTSIAMADGSIVMMGGHDGTIYRNDVWRLVPTGSSAQNPSHTYTMPGTYQVALQAYNAGGYNSTRKMGYINATAAPVPIANFTSNITQGGYNLTVKFTDQSTEIPVSWNWSFGDGTYSTAQHPVHTYAQIEDKRQWYNVSLNVTNAFTSNTTEKTRYIHLMSFSEYYRSISDPAGNISTSTFVGVIEDWRLQRSVPTFTVAPSTSIFVGLIEDWRLQRPLV